eukprot:FR741082.1.p2 GENE.FR741082.1~~FR741082.1.p2  ORF type:complete len:103 (-),score=5.38 FR741082.1:131-439(-)
MLSVGENATNWAALCRKLHSLGLPTNWAVLGRVLNWPCCPGWGNIGLALGSSWSKHKSFIISVRGGWHLTVKSVDILESLDVVEESLSEDIVEETEPRRAAD